jgi:hypothetical protein
MNNVRHILNMDDDNPNSLNWIIGYKYKFQLKQNSENGCQNKRTFQAT